MHFQFRSERVRLWVWVEPSGECLVRVYPRRYGPPLLGRPFRVNLADPVHRAVLLDALPPSVRDDVRFLLLRAVVPDVQWASGQLAREVLA